MLDIQHDTHRLVNLSIDFIAEDDQIIVELAANQDDVPSTTRQELSHNNDCLISDSTLNDLTSNPDICAEEQPDVESTYISSES